MAPVVRRPRFRRATNPPPLRLTVRDAHIIRQVHTHRFLRSTHLVALFGGNPQPFLRRLQRLYHHGYLDRPPAQLDYFQQGGGHTMVYGLGNRGADFLHERFGLPRPNGNWTAKNRSIKQVFLQHALLVADVMVALERSCGLHPRIQLIEQSELLAGLPEERRTRKNPFQWHVDVKANDRSARLGVIPDKVFALRFLDQPPERNTAYFFLEADRGTMPVIRKGVQQTSFYRKLLAYHATWEQKLHVRHFSIPRFRVLTVTSTPERANHILAASRQLGNGKGSGPFLVTDSPTLNINPDFLCLPFSSGQAGSQVRLVAEACDSQTTRRSGWSMQKQQNIAGGTPPPPSPA